MWETIEIVSSWFNLLFDAVTGKPRIYTIDDFYNVHQVLLYEVSNIICWLEKLDDTFLLQPVILEWDYFQ